MYTLSHFRPGLSITVLFSLIIISCQKAAPTAADAASSPNTKTTASLTVGPVPAILWWGNVPAIPYTDNIPGDIPIRNQYPLGFAINGEGFVLGAMLTNSKYGLNDYVTDLWQYDLPTLSWTKKSSFPGDAGSLIGAVSFVIGDNAYIVTGNATWQYNQPTDTWTQKAYIFSVQRIFATAFAINGKGYLGLGSNDGAPTIQELNDWWVYDPVADKWTQKNNFPGEKREGAAGFVVDSKGYVVSGSHYANGHGNWGQKVWQYDPVADSWTQKADFPGGHTDQKSISAGVCHQWRGIFPGRADGMP
jgi:N-acetylneuraminic acid mutarotase